MIRISRISIGLVALIALFISGCKEEVAVPDPIKLTREAVGNYCNMIIADHPGPKAQIYEKGRAVPLWFSSVRDGLAYMALPGEAQNVVAFYVHDMGRATSWDRPQDSGIWIKADTAFFVIGSTRRGGMGAKETVPFKDRPKADAFVGEFGGKIVSYKDIPQDYVLGDGDEHTPGAAGMNHHGKHTQ